MELVASKLEWLKELAGGSLWASSAVIFCVAVAAALLLRFGGSKGAFLAAYDRIVEIGFSLMLAMVVTRGFETVKKPFSPRYGTKVIAFFVVVSFSILALLSWSLNGIGSYHWCTQSIVLWAMNIVLALQAWNIQPTLPRWRPFALAHAWCPLLCVLALHALGIASLAPPPLPDYHLVAGDAEFARSATAGGAEDETVIITRRGFFNQIKEVQTITTAPLPAEAVREMDSPADIELDTETGGCAGELALVREQLRLMEQRLAALEGRSQSQSWTEWWSWATPRVGYFCLFVVLSFALMFQPFLVCQQLSREARRRWVPEHGFVLARNLAVTALLLKTTSWATWPCLAGAVWGAARVALALSVFLIGAGPPWQQFGSFAQPACFLAFVHTVGFRCLIVWGVPLELVPLFVGAWFAARLLRAPLVMALGVKVALLLWVYDLRNLLVTVWAALLPVAVYVVLASSSVDFRSLVVQLWRRVRTLLANGLVARKAKAQ